MCHEKKIKFNDNYICSNNVFIQYFSFIYFSLNKVFIFSENHIYCDSFFWCRSSLYILRLINA